MSTLKDVAQHAGVSIGTVSKALNGDKKIRPDNLQRIKESIELLNYRPNMTARTLRTKVSHSIALIVPDISNPYYPEMARGVEDAAQRLGFTVFMCSNDRSADKEKEYIDQLIDKNVDGIILVKPLMQFNDLLRIREYGHILLIDANSNFQSHFDYVNLDDCTGTQLAMELLINLGHKRIAYIQGLMDSESASCRFSAYQKIIEEKGLFSDFSYVYRGRYDWKSGYDATFQLMNHKNPPTAIFAANDMMAFGAMKALRELGLNVPDDVSVIGYDDIIFASFYSPQLTTIRQPKYEIGKSGAEILIQRINGQCNSKDVIGMKLQPEIIYRETVSRVK